MNILDLHASVAADFRDFVRSFFTAADERARAFVGGVLRAGFTFRAAHAPLDRFAAKVFLA